MGFSAVSNGRELERTFAENGGLSLLSNMVSVSADYFIKNKINVTYMEDLALNTIFLFVKGRFP